MATLAGVNVLVIGANGFLGKHLLARLYRENAKIHAVSRSSQPSDSRITWWTGSAAGSVWIRELVARIKPDIIYQLASASLGGQDLRFVLPTFESDLQTTVNTLAAACEVGCSRLIMTGSLEEPMPSCKPKAPGSPYAAAKAAALLYGRMFQQLYSVPVVILRPFMTYGPGQKEHKIIPYTIKSMLRGESPELASGTRLVDWVYVGDVIESFIAAATAPDAVGKDIDVGSGLLTSIREVVEQIQCLIPSAPNPRFGALHDRANEQVRVADLTGAEQILGWRPSTSLSQGLSSTITWYRENVQPEPAPNKL
jgi:UDP-glucose 4-epimerase